MYYILMCRSLTLAQRAARLLQNAGLFASVTKAPQSANPGGCTYGVKVAQRHLETGAALLERAGIPILKLLEVPAGGPIREVQR